MSDPWGSMRKPCWMMPYHPCMQCGRTIQPHAEHAGVDVSVGERRGMVHSHCRHTIAPTEVTETSIRSLAAVTIHGQAVRHADYDHGRTCGCSS